ncbi:MAG: DUF6364 family protein [Spirochaetia bacterium]|nr:DUF6364 family protein [Spirochaetia bacterium]
MKTTLHLPNPLLEDAKKTAKKEGTSLTKLVQKALQEYIQKKTGKKTHKLKENHFKGNGFTDPSLDGNWDKIREIIYEKRGG